jgi:hypothetical protein
MLALGRIEGKVDSIFPTIARQRADHEKLEDRTRSLENWRWYLAGLFSLSLVAVIMEIILR